LLLCRGLLAVAVALATLAASAEDLVTTRPIAPGVEFRTLHRTPGPRQVRVVRIQRDEPLILLETGLARGEVRGVETLSAIVGRENRAAAPVVAAVNGDFFHMAGQTWAGCALGPVVREGELVQTGGGRLCFFVTGDGVPHIGPLEVRVRLVTPAGSLSIQRVNVPPVAGRVTAYTARWGWPVKGGVVLGLSGLPLRTAGRWRGKVLRVVAPGTFGSVVEGRLTVVGPTGAGGLPVGLTPGAEVELVAAVPGLKQPVRTAVGGGPLLLRGGKIVPDERPRAPRHPRTAVGFNRESIVLLTVDGRQPGWSMGVTLAVLADWMRELGCEEALNLDGGGSTTAWVRGEVVNRPSDGSLRAVANALLVRSRAPLGTLGRLIVRPETVATFPGQPVPLRIWLTDENYNPVAVELDRLAADVTESRATVPIRAAIRNGALTLDGGPGRAVVVLRYGGVPKVRARIAVRVVTSCPTIEVDPPLIHLCGGEEVRFRSRGRLDDGVSVVLPAKRLTWMIDGDAAVPLGPGRFRARTPGADATVTVRLGKAAGRARIRVADERLIERFEAGSPARFTTFPATGVVTGGLTMQSGPASEGGRFCRMSFDLGAPGRTRAAYVRLDRKLGTVLRVSFRARLTGTAPAWVRVALVDGNLSRHTFTAASRLANDGKWRSLSVRLPTGMKPPVVWQSVYVVETGQRTCRGVLDVDALRVAAIRDPAS